MPCRNSFIEEMKSIDPLTNPTGYGEMASDAFDVVVPSMPGYGYSENRPPSGYRKVPGVIVHLDLPVADTNGGKFAGETRGTRF